MWKRLTFCVAERHARRFLSPGFASRLTTREEIYR
nr:MAG TPA: hypothetical protein [Caudoviricetes sp.]